MVEMIMKPTESKLCAKALKKTSYLQVGNLQIMNVRNLRLASSRADNKPILVRHVPATNTVPDHSAHLLLFFCLDVRADLATSLPHGGRSLTLWTESAIRCRGLSSQKSDNSWHCKEKTEKRHARRAWHGQRKVEVESRLLLKKVPRRLPTISQFGS